MKNEVKKFGDVEIPGWLKWTLGIFYAAIFLLGWPILWAIVGLLTMIVWGALLSWRGIPPDTYVYLKTNGVRGDRLYSEGWHFIIPVLQEFDVPVKYEKCENKISVWLTCKDKIKVLAEAEVEWWPNKERMKDFIRVSAAIISGALTGDFKKILHEVSAAHNADVIMENKKIMGVIASCLFRLSVVPHDNPKKALNDDMPNDPPIAGLTENPEVDIIAFYTRPEVMARILKRLENESKNKDDESKVEKDQFIDVTNVSIYHWAYTEGVEAANERERVAKEDAKAITITDQKVREVKANMADMSPKERQLAAEVVSGLSKRTIEEKVYDVKGVQGVVDIKIGDLTKKIIDAGGDDKKEVDDKKKEGG